MGDSLSEKLGAARRQWRWVTAASGLAVAVSAGAALALVSFYVDRIIVLTPQGRLTWLLLILVALVAGLVLFVTLPLLRRIPDEIIAVTVERRFPSLSERLLSTVELARAGALAGSSGQLVGALARDTEGIAGSLDFRHAVDPRPLRRAGTLACVAGLLVLGHVLVMPRAMSTWFLRLLHPGADIPVYARTLVWVTPEDKVVPRGEPVVLGVRVGGRPAQIATLRYRFDGAAWTSVRLSSPHPLRTPKDDQLAFDFRVGDAQQSITYYARAGDGQSNPHTIRVEDRPTILGVKVRLEYPTYTHLPGQTISATAGNIVAPVGTRVSVEATANKPLRQATFVEDGHTRGAWRVEGAAVTGALSVRRDETYSLHLTDRNGFTSQNPPVYTIRAQPDRAPTVQVVQPGADIDRTPLGSVLLKVSATDDYGVDSMSLAYRAGRRDGTLPLPGANGGKQALVGGSWSLAHLGLKAGDTVVYEAQARDDDSVEGPHIGRSASYRIHIIGMEEMRERLDAAQAAEREALRQLVAAQKAAQGELAQARNQPGRRDPAAQAEQAQRAIAQASAELSNRMQSTTEQMHDNLVASPADLQRRDQVQQSLRGLSQKQMPAAAETIRRNELGSAAQQEQGIREELERLAQELAPAPQIPQLAQQADRLAQEQQKLAEKSDLAAEQTQGRSSAQMTAQERATMNQLARQQSALRTQTQALQESLNRASQDAAQRGTPEAHDLSQAARQLSESGAQQNQRSAEQNLQASKPSGASPQQNAAAKALRDLANRLDDAGQRLSNQSLESRSRRLDAAAERLMQMANQERNLSHQAQANPNAQQAQQLAQQQRSLSSQGHQLDSALQDAPAAASAMRNAQQNMQQAEANLSKGTPRDAYQPAQQATTQLLRAAKEAMDASNALKEEQDAREAQHQVQQLAREQRALEHQTKQLDSARKGGQLTPDQQKQAQRFAQTQQGLLQRGREMREDMPSQGFKAALDQATNRMDDANRGLQQQNTGDETRLNQEHAAQRLERIARALGQKAEGAQQQAQGGGQQGGADQDMAEASGDLQLAREMEQQIRQETAGINERRKSNPNNSLTAQQQRELNWLTQGQRETRQVAEDASQKLRGSPDIGQTVQKAAESMDDVEDMLRRSETGDPTQGKQEQIVSMLDRALQQARQAMRDQQQQQRMAQQGSQRGAQQQAQMRPGGTQPASRTYSPIEQAQNATFGQTQMRGRGFGALSPRAQQALREGQQERVPAEYRELVNEYYKALSEHAH